MTQPLSVSLCSRIVALLLIFIHRVGPYVDIYNYIDMLIWTPGATVTALLLGAKITHLSIFIHIVSFSKRS